jgi:hypothetical protein
MHWMGAGEESSGQADPVEGQHEGKYGIEDDAARDEGNRDAQQSVPGGARAKP